jgi:hypothetical protein
MRKGINGLVAAACLAASSLLFPLQTFADKEVVSNQIYPITMVSESGYKTQEKTRIQVSIDSDIDTLYLGIYTQDYNRRDWTGDEKELLTLPNRFTNLNHDHLRFFIFGPSRAKISDIEQSAYLVPRYQWETELQPYEKDQRTQLLMETVSKAIDKIISKIPFLNKSYDKYIKDAEQKEEDYYDALFADINPDYVRKRIPSYIPKTLIGQTETAREYAIQFDIGNTKDEIPMYVWLKLAEGKNQKADHGSPKHSYGELENISIKFTLNETKKPIEILDDLFFHEQELNLIKKSKLNPEGCSSNPGIFHPENLTEEEKADRVSEIGIERYIIPELGDGRERDLSLGIVKFQTSLDRGNFMQRRLAEGKITYPTFYKSDVLSYFVHPTLEEILSITEGYSNEQVSMYIDLMLNYMDRTMMSVILDKDPIQSDKILKNLKKYQLNSNPILN